jgi:dUTP pyrophosphatase
MEIKTIRAKLDAFDYFDTEVNKAIADGWYLQERYVVPGSENDHTSLVAEMVRGKTKPKFTIPIKYFDDEIDKLEKIPVGDWIDLRSAETVELKQGEYKLIRLGVGMILPHGFEAHILPRSSTPNKFGIMCANSMGIIDNSYSGDGDEWKFPAVAIRDTVIHKNDRIAQFRIVRNQPRFEFEIVDHLNDVSRGGIGSTGWR